MLAERGSMTFFYAAGLSSFLPTGLALYFLRPYGRFWALFSNLSLAVAATGPCFEILNSFEARLSLDHQPLWALVSFLGLVRVFGAPVLALGFFASSFITPGSNSRRKLLVWAGIETALCAYVVVLVVFWHRLF